MVRSWPLAPMVYVYSLSTPVRPRCPPAVSWLRILLGCKRVGKDAILAERSENALPSFAERSDTFFISLSSFFFFGLLPERA